MHRTKGVASRLRQKQDKKPKEWESDFRLPEGVTFEQISQLSKPKPSRRNEAQKLKAKEELISKFIQKNKALLKNTSLKFIPWTNIDQYIIQRTPEVQVPKKKVTAPFNQLPALISKDKVMLEAIAYP